MTRARRLIGASLAALLVPSMAWSVRADDLPEAETAAHVTAVEPAGAATRPTVRVRDLGAVEARTAALLLSGQSGGDLPGAILWCAEQDTDEGGRVPTHLYVELDGGALLDSARPGRVPVVVAAYAIDEQGVVVGSLAYGVIVEGEGLRDALAPGGLRFVGEMALPPGSVSLRVMVRVHGTERFLLTREELRLAPADTGEAAVSAPLFTVPEDTWLEARQQDLFGFAECVHGVVPAAKPVLDVTRPMSFVAIASGWPEGARLRASVLDRWGRTLEQPQLSIGRKRPAAGDAEIMEIEMLPFDVPQGEYRVTLQVLTDTFEELAARGLRAVLVSGEANISWAGLDEPAGGAPDPAQATVISGDEPDKRQLESAYVAALRVMAEGDEMAARRAVADLERSVFDTDRASGTTALRRAELTVAGRLEDRDPQSLPPLIVLHRNLCHTYVAYHEIMLARHSATMVTELAEMFGTIKGGSQVDDIAEYSLVSVALDLVQRSDPGAGASLLERTLELDPESILALVNLAFLREQTGQWSEAVDLLQTLVGVDPENLEARLRLGVNLRRTGRHGAARKTLGSLLGNSTPDWIRSIAAQELAHLLVKKGRLDEAERVLVRAMDSTADRQTLAIQLAWTRDQAGRAAEATATLAHVERDIGHPIGSARLRYCQWPDMDVYGIGDALNREARGRLPELRRALDSKELR